MTGFIASATGPSQQRLLNPTYIRDPGPRGTRYYTADRAFLAAADRFLPASGGSAFPVCPDMLHRWRHSSASRRRNWWPCPRPLGATPSGKCRSTWQRPQARPSEILGMSCEDIDRTVGTIQIRRGPQPVPLVERQGERPFTDRKPRDAMPSRESGATDVRISALGRARSQPVNLLNAQQARRFVQVPP
jgi:hypothetical protein